MHRFLRFTLLCFVLASCGTSDVTTPTGSSVSAQQPTHAPQAAAPQSTHTPRAAPTSRPTQSLRTTDNPYPSPLTDFPIPDPSDAELNRIKTPNPRYLLPIATPPPPMPDAPLLSTIAPPQTTEPLTRFFVTRGDYNQTTGHFSTTLAWVDIQTGDETVVASLPDNGPPPHGVIAPDHQYVAYAQSSYNGKYAKFYVHQLGSDDHILLSNQPRLAYTPLTQEIFWSPDSQWVLFLHFGAEGGEIRVYNPQRQEMLTLATYGAIQLHGWLDSDTILFTLPHNMAKNPELWTINRVTGEQHNVATYLHRGMEDQLLSPNKRWLYVAYEDVFTLQDASLIYDMETATWTELDQFYGDNVLWTATSELIMYSVNFETRLDLWTAANPASTHPVQVQTAPPAARNLLEGYASPGGHWLLFISDPPEGQRYKDWFSYTVYHTATNQWQTLNADQHWFAYRFFGW